MGNESREVDIKKIPPNFGFHSFNTNIAEQPIRFEVMKFKDSIYLWIGDARCRILNDLSLAILSEHWKEPACTKIMGEPTGLTSNNLATVLSKKLKKPIYVSYNLSEDRWTVAAVNTRIFEEIKRSEQHF